MEREHVPATVTAKDFEQWLTQTLSGKRLDPSSGQEEGRIIFLLEDGSGACRRTDVVMTKDAIEVRSGRLGSEALVEMTIHADTESWVRYLESPVPENLKPIPLHPSSRSMRSDHSDCRSSAAQPLHPTRPS